MGLWLSRRQTTLTPFAYRLIFEKPHDTTSPIVGVISNPFAWDRALLGLLPDSVYGIYTVIRNSCGQSYTYELNGRDAIFQGDGDLHESDFQNYESSIDLALNTNLAAATTSGHCMYSMVRERNCSSDLQISPDDFY